MIVADRRAPLSVVVATRDRPAALRRCLAALAAEIQDGDEVVVVDSASLDRVAVAEVVDQASIGAVTPALIRAPRPGASLARNLGWQAARHRVVAFVDDDVEVMPGWAASLAEVFADPDVSFATGWIGVPDAQADVSEPNPLMIAPMPFRIDHDRRGLLGASANFAATVEALKDVGGFDERVGPGTWIAAGEDHELFDRLVAAGWCGAYTPDAKVEHDQSRTRRESFALHWRIGKGAGMRLARLARHDRRRLPFVARELLLDDIAAALARSIREGYQTGTVFALLRLAGLVTGFVATPFVA